MFVIYANEEDAKCDWAKYRDPSSFNRMKFICGVHRVFNRIKGRNLERQKAECAELECQGIHIMSGVREGHVCIAHHRQSSMGSSSQGKERMG